MIILSAAMHFVLPPQPEGLGRIRFQKCSHGLCYEFENSPASVEPPPINMYWHACVPTMTLSKLARSKFHVAINVR